MFTIDRLDKIDAFAIRAFAALRRGLDWLGDQYETLLVDAAYLVAQSKIKAIIKAEDKISALEDAQAEAAATYIEAKAKLRADFERLVESLDKAQDKVEADMHAKIAAAALALVAATKDYDATIQAASDKLGVEIES